MSEPIAIASYDHMPPAVALVKELSQRGFEAGLINETAEQALKFFTAHAHAQFRVTVPPEEMLPALAAISTMPESPLEEADECPVRQVIRCPDCKSTLVEFPQFSRKTVIGALPSLAAAAGLIEQNYYCSHCHFTWAPAVSASPPISDALS